VSLIGFGFTVAKFFEGVNQSSDTQGRWGPEGPRDVGLILIAAGVISLLIFLWQFHRAVAYLSSGDFAIIATARKRPLHITAYMTAVVVILIGIAAFGIILFRF
jgi:putative membrane protein